MPDIEKIFETLKKNTIEVVFGDIGSAVLAKGVSKFGGKPDLPANFQWKYYTTETYSDETKKPRPLAFLLQLNCEEISPYDSEKLLPDKGMLYFFYELESQKWGFDPNDKGCAHVFYYEGAVDSLVSSELPQSLPDNFVMPEIPLTFKNRDDVPDWSEYAEHNETDENYEEYGQAREKLIGDGEYITKFLGYADIIQSEMLLECEMTCGLNKYTGNGFLEMTDDEKKLLTKNALEWTLLFQLDTVAKGDFELMFGDCGRIYFYIRKNELRDRNFENVWLILQCY